MGNKKKLVCYLCKTEYDDTGCHEDYCSICEEPICRECRYGNPFLFCKKCKGTTI